MSSGWFRVRTKMKFISANGRKWIRPLLHVCPRSAATLVSTSMNNVPNMWCPPLQRCGEVLQHCFNRKVRWNLLDSKAAVQLRVSRVPSTFRKYRHSPAAATSNICTVIIIRWAQPNRSLQTRHRRATAKAVCCVRITTPNSVKSLAKRQCLDFRARTRRTSARTATRYAIALTRSC